jgi:hypothetical protein
LCSTPYSRALCRAMARRSADISTAITCKGGSVAGQWAEVLSYNMFSKIQPRSVLCQALS